jgi:hypothetical protein
MLSVVPLEALDGVLGAHRGHRQQHRLLEAADLETSLTPEAVVSSSRPISDTNLTVVHRSRGNIRTYCGRVRS